MANLIYQVKVGRQSKSKLYDKCIESVSNYCKKYNIDHIVQTAPKLRIAPDPFMTNRSKDATAKHGGFLPIFEKENAFDLLDKYDQIAIIDADIFIREDAPNIFEQMLDVNAMGLVCERGMRVQKWYRDKLKNYSAMQYANLHSPSIDFKPTQSGGYEFFNMGMMVINCEKFKPYLKGQTAKQFLERAEFMDFINGKGNWKWSTDQTLLNYFVKKYNVPVQMLEDKWNGLFTAHEDIKSCYFVHFFLKDKLPNGGEDVESLMKLI